MCSGNENMRFVSLGDCLLFSIGHFSFSPSLFLSLFLSFFLHYFLHINNWSYLFICGFRNAFSCHFPLSHSLFFYSISFFLRLQRNHPILFSIYLHYASYGVFISGCKVRWFTVFPNKHSLHSLSFFSLAIFVSFLLLFCRQTNVNQKTLSGDCSTICLPMTIFFCLSRCFLLVH